MTESPQHLLASYARSGSEAAFRQVVGHYGALVLNSARRRVQDHHLAEEVAQNVFSLLAKRAAKVSQYDSVSAWLYETTKYESAKVLRKQKRHRRRVEALVNETKTTHAMSSDHDQKLRELLPDLEEALDSLKLPERQILFARFFDGKSYREIAADTGRGESACKMTLSRALGKLSTWFRRRDITFSAMALGTLLQIEWAKAATTTSISSIATRALRSTPSTNISTQIFLMTNSTKTFILVALALIILAGIPVLIHQTGKGESASSQITRETDGVTSQGFSAGESDRRTMVRRRDAQKAKFVKTHQIKDLKNFYLPPIKLENKTLAEAMEILIKQYQEVCLQTEEGVLPIEWALEGEALPISRLDLKGDFFSNCRLIAAFTGTSFQIEENELIFAEIPDGPAFAVAQDIPPTFLDTIADVFEHTTLIEEDPFEPPPHRKVPLLEILKEAGFLSEDGTISVLEEWGSLISHAGQRNRARIRALVDHADAHVPVQVLYTFTMESQDGVKVLPKVVARPGEPATIDIGKSYIESKDGQVIEDLTGIHIELTTELYGLGERSRLSYFYTEEPSEENVALFKRSGRLNDLNLNPLGVDDRLVTKTSTQRLQQTPSQLTVTDVDGDLPSLEFTTERLDATGKLIVSE